MPLLKINWSPNPKQLRVFGLTCLAACLLLGTRIYFRGSFVGLQLRATAAYLVCTIGMMIALIALVVPRALRPLYITLTAITLPIGFVLSYMLLYAVFFLVLTPAGILMRALGKDPMQRGFERGAATYWQPHRSTRDLKRFFRQY